MKKQLLKLSLVSIFAAASLPAIASDPLLPMEDHYGMHGIEQRVSTQNPGHPIWRQQELVVQRTLSLSDRVSTHAAEGDLELVQYPAVFGEYGFSNMKDDRTNGFDTLTHTFTLGMDCMTVGDLFVGGMASFSDYNGDDDFKNDDEGDSLTFTLYASKALADDIFAGVSVSYTDDDNEEADVDTYTYSVAPYVSFVMYLEEVKISITPTYSLSFSENDPTDDKSNRGEFLLATRATLGVTEAVSVYAGATVHQVLHSRLMDGENGQDHLWVATSVGMDWMLTEAVSLQASVGYDAFNENYRDNVNAQAGITVLF